MNRKFLERQIFKGIQCGNTKGLNTLFKYILLLTVASIPGISRSHKSYLRSAALFRTVCQTLRAAYSRFPLLQSVAHRPCAFARWWCPFWCMHARFPVPKYCPVIVAEAYYMRTPPAQRLSSARVAFFRDPKQAMRQGYVQSVRFYQTNRVVVWKWMGTFIRRGSEDNGARVTLCRSIVHIWIDNCVSSYLQCSAAEEVRPCDKIVTIYCILYIVYLQVHKL